MDINNNKKVNEFLNNVCKYVKFKDSHKEIQIELQNHIEEKSLDYIKTGLSEDDAINKTLSEMGDISSIGNRFNSVYKGGLDVKSISLSLFLLIVGVICWTLLLKFNSSTEISPKTLICSIFISTIVFYFIYNFNYKKLENYSTKITIISLAFLVVNILFSTPINGNKYISLMNITFNLNGFSLLLISIFLPSTFSKLKGTSRLFIPIIFLALTSTLFFISTNNFCYLLIFFVVFFYSIYSCKYNLSYIFCLLFISFASICLYLASSEPYRVSRLFSFITYKSDLGGVGYLYNQIHNVINSATLFGHGLIKINIPSLHSELIFTYILHTFGWVGVSILSIIICLFLFRLYKISNLVKDTFGKLILRNLVILLLIQFLLNISMNLGLSPLIAISLPFISYGGFNILMNSIIIGIIMSIYKRRNLCFSS